MSDYSYNEAEYKSLRKFDLITATMDFTPRDGIANPETINGVFIKFAENIPAGYIPTAYVMLDNGTMGWFPPWIIKLVRHFDVANDAERIKHILTAIDNIQIELKQVVDLLQVLNTELRNSLPS